MLAISVLINVIFVIVIMYRKNKNKDYVPPNSERTDFDIDFGGEEMAKKTKKNRPK